MAFALLFVAIKFTHNLKNCTIGAAKQKIGLLKFYQVSIHWLQQLSVVRGFHVKGRGGDINYSL